MASGMCVWMHMHIHNIHTYLDDHKISVTVKGLN